jgi:hypothetical protein
MMIVITNGAIPIPSERSQQNYVPVPLSDEHRYFCHGAMIWHIIERNCVAIAG